MNNHLAIGTLSNDRLLFLTLTDLTRLPWQAYSTTTISMGKQISYLTSGWQHSLLWFKAQLDWVQRRSSCINCFVCVSVCCGMMSSGSVNHSNIVVHLWSAETIKGQACRSPSHLVVNPPFLSVSSQHHNNNTRGINAHPNKQTNTPVCAAWLNGQYLNKTPKKAVLLLIAHNFQK